MEHDSNFYLYYYAKNKLITPSPQSNPIWAPEGLWTEQTGLAVSKDLKNCKRHPDNPVIRVTIASWDDRFCSDPCVFSDGDLWVVFYYGQSTDGFKTWRRSQDGIAFSKDMYNWIKHPEPIIRFSSPGEIDSKDAAKPSIVYHDSNLFHFYVACKKYEEGDVAKNLYNESRCISVTTSMPL